MEFTQEEQEIVDAIITKSLEIAKAHPFTDEEIFAKAADMGAKQPEEGQVDPPAALKKKGGKAGISDAALKPEETADEVKVKMAKSIKWYGEENDAFKAGTQGRHSYASSVNEFYDEALAKANAPEQKVLKKSVKEPKDYDLNDMIEKDLMKSWSNIETELQMEEFKKSQGNFTRKSFSNDELLKSLGMTAEEADKVLK